MEVPLIVAVIAAVASLSGAGMAFVAARNAQRSAREINGLNHQIALVDRNDNELREAYLALTASMGENALSSGGAAKVAGCAAALGGCSAATEELRKACKDTEKDAMIVYGLATNPEYQGKLDNLYTTPPEALREAYNECRGRLRDEREKLAALRA